MRLPEEIVTPRLLLRRPRAGDGAMINQAVHESFAELSPWMQWATTLPTKEQSEAFARDGAVRYNNGSSAELLILHRETGSFIGATGMPRIDWDLPGFEIGYWCRTGETGKGYVSESTWWLAKALFALGAKRVEIRVDDLNRRSWRVAERLGFTFTTLQKGDLIANDGSLRDTRVYVALSLAQLEQPSP